MSTHYIPGKGHVTLNPGDPVPAGAIARPVIDPKVDQIIQDATGYLVLPIDQKVIDAQKDLDDIIKGGPPKTVDDRLERIEKLLLYIIGV